MARKEATGKAPAKSRKIGVLLVDDHPIVRQGLMNLVQQEPDMTVCAEAASSHEALKACEEMSPDIAIVDLSIKEGSGLELTKDIKVRHPKLPVLILSMHDEAIYCERALRAGAKGYLMKDQAGENVVAAIRKVLAGDIYLSTNMAQTILTKVATGDPARGASPVDRLSDRELEIFRLLGQGLGTKDIAARLHRSVKTVDAHRENIKRKLHLGNATDLLQYAIQWVRSEKD